MDTSIVDRTLDVYIAVGEAAVQAIRPEVMAVLVSLAVIGMTWAHLSNTITQRQNPISLLIFQFMTVGFFVWLLDNWTTLMNALMGGMIQMGLKAGGAAGTAAMTPQEFIHPSYIATSGMKIAQPLVDAVGFWGWLTGTNIIMALCMVIVIFAFFIMSIQVFVAIVEFKLGVVWCFFLTALGVWSKSSFASEKSLGYVLSSGVKLFALATVVSVGSVLMLNLGTFADPSAPTYNEALGVAFGALVLVGLSWFAPSKVAGVVSGGPSLGAGAALGTMAAVGATAAVGGIGVAAAAARAAAGTSALRAATTGAGVARSGASGLGLPSGGPSGGSGGSGGAGGGGPGRGSPSPQMRANPVWSSTALETMDRIEQGHAATRESIASGTPFKWPETAEHERAQAYRGLAWDIGNALQDTDPELSAKIGSELDRIEAMKFEVARAGVSPRLNSALLAEEYRNVTTRALNLDGGGGFETPSLSTSLTPEGRARNAALAESLGVGAEIRAMAAKGRTTRQIAEGLGDRLRPVNRMAERIGQGGDANLHRMAVVQAYKDEHGIPNHDAADFRDWASAERKAQATKERAEQSAQAPQAPAWARGVQLKSRGMSLASLPANINAMVPRGSERAAGMTANEAGARD